VHPPGAFADLEILAAAFTNPHLMFLCNRSRKLQPHSGKQVRGLKNYSLVMVGTGYSFDAGSGTPHKSGNYRSIAGAVVFRNSAIDLALQDVHRRPENIVRLESG
jgi:hypothetical protein